MASTEEEFSSFTTKGRRTKRQRLLVAASASSTYRGSGPADPGCSDINSFGSSSSDNHDVMSEVTTEEEDMANCLILLAQGVEKKGSSKSMIKAKISNNNNNNNNIIIASTSTSNNNINNIGVYECKTCNKTFPSFQALGGHRTSHKKIKPPPTTTPIPSPDRHEDNREVVVDLADVMEFSNIKKIVVHDNNNNNNNNNKARVHECSICGSEFPSGQALGGHMRRHRAAVPPSTTTAITVSTEAATVIDTGGPRNILSLDLNLPAPDDQDEVHEDDDHHMETKFVHVLPRPAPLVDCHY